MYYYYYISTKLPKKDTPPPILVGWCTTYLWNTPQSPAPTSRPVHTSFWPAPLLSSCSSPCKTVSTLQSPCKTMSVMQSSCKTVSVMQSSCKTVSVMQSLPAKQCQSCNLPAKQCQSCNLSLQNNVMQSPCKTMSVMQSPKQCQSCNLPAKQCQSCNLSLQNSVSHAISACKTVSVMQSLPAKRCQSCNQFSTMDSLSVNKKKVGPHHVNTVHCATQEHERWRMWLLASNISCKLHQQHAMNTIPKQLFLFPVGRQKTCYATQHKWWILVNLITLHQE